MFWFLLRVPVPCQYYVLQEEFVVADTFIDTCEDNRGPHAIFDLIDPILDPTLYGILFSSTFMRVFSICKVAVWNVVLYVLLYYKPFPPTSKKICMTIVQYRDLFVYYDVETKIPRLINVPVQ